MSILSRANLTRRLCLDAILITAAMMLSYLEALIPMTLLLPLPGFKLGRANVVTILAFVLVSKKDAAVISALRILLMGLLFGSVTSLFFSAMGGLLAFLALCFASRFLQSCSFLGVSVLCAAAHNVGQLLAAVCLFGFELLLSYLPLLLFAALLSGALTGCILNLSIPTLSRLSRSSFNGRKGRTVNNEEGAK